MPSGYDVEQYLSSFNGNGRLNEEEIFLYGSGLEEIRGICICWMATAPAIKFAASEDCNLIICHEALTFYDYPVWASWVTVKEPWESDRTRLKLLEKHGISVLRVHSTVDVTHVGPALWDALELPAPQFSGWAYSHHTVGPVTVAELAARLRRALPIDRVRMTGDPARTVTEIGTCWGGGGLDRNMRIWVEYLFQRGIEALIVGETCDFAQRFALESGIALLEGGHSATEDPGLRRLAKDIGRHLPDTKVVFRPQEVPWVTL